MTPTPWECRMLVCSTDTSGSGNGQKYSLLNQETVNRIIEASGGQLDLKFGISINDQLSDQIMLSIIASSFTNDVTFGISKSQPSNMQQNSQFSLFDNDSFAKNPQAKGAEGQEVSNESVETPKQDNYLDGDSIIPDFLEGKF